MKERQVEEDIKSYSWLSTDNMWADILTKEMHLPQGLDDVILENKMDLPKTPINQVKGVGTEVRMHNIRNRRQLENEECSDSKIGRYFYCQTNLIGMLQVPT